MTVVAACQVKINIDEPATTAEALTSAVRAAARAGATVVVLPELAHSGSAFTSPDEALDRAEDATGPTVRAMSQLAAELDLVLVFGFCERDGDNGPYNSAVLIDRGDVRAVYRKTHLWNQEKLIFVPGGEAPPVVDTSAGRVAVMICYDLEFPEMVRDVTLRGAQLIACPANWPVVPKPSHERPIEVAKAQANACANHVFIAIADRCGVERGFDWFGSSVICDPTGFPIAGPSRNEPAILLALVDLAEADDKRISPHNDVLTDRRLDLRSS